MMAEEATSVRLVAHRMPAASIVDVCGFVDELGEDAVGELIFETDGTPQGTAFIEQGRVCWAAARGLARRLTELLAVPAGLSADAMEHLYRQCKDTRTPLGECLVQKGLLEPERLRTALMQHTAESLTRLCTRDALAGWCPRRAGGYSPRFTFSTAELLVATSSGAHGSHAGVAREELREFFPAPATGEWAAAFVRSGRRSTPDPVAVHGDFPRSASILLRAGKWAANTLDLARPHDSSDLMVSSRVAGKAVVAWPAGGAIIFGCTGVHGPARILHRRGAHISLGSRREGHGHGGL